MLDSVGVGDAPDAADYGDDGCNTLRNLSQVVGGLKLPNLQKLGLGNLTDIEGVPPVEAAAGAFGRLTPQAAGKDSVVGHWEIMGQIRREPLPLYPEGFPAEIIEPFEARTGREAIGNRPASGTVIIEELFDEHVATGALIVYTSGDSVFQIAAHEEIVPVEELYRYCKIAREILTGEHEVARVIARPFVGSAGSLVRTDRRRDFPLPPPVPTALDLLQEAGIQTVGVGKIHDIFAGRGVGESIHISDNSEGAEAVIQLLSTSGPEFIFANFNDFDTEFGHRNDADGYARALESLDADVADMLEALADDTLLIFTADHGTDPTSESTDHSRERVPLLVAGAPVTSGLNLGTRETYADLGATICEILGAESPPDGRSFADELAGDRS